MALDTSTVGFETEPVSFSYDWKTVALYALAVGATPAELDYLYEARGPRVLPTFGVIPAYGPVSQLFVKTQCDMTRLVHGGQTLRVHRPLPPAGTLVTVGKIDGIYDMKKLAQVVLSTRTSLNGEPCFDTEWQLLIRDAGGFGGPRPPKTEVPKLAEGQSATPTFSAEQATRPEQALLYRLTGDLNPLHADPAFARAVGFEQGPILHGLCTYGFVGRALLQHACAGDPARLKALSVQFRKPVWPGDVLSTQGFAVGDGRYVLQTSVVGRPDAVLTSAGQKWLEGERSMTDEDKKRIVSEPPPPTDEIDGEWGGSDDEQTLVRHIPEGVSPSQPAPPAAAVAKTSVAPISAPPKAAEASTPPEMKAAPPVVSDEDDEDDEVEEEDDDDEQDEAPVENEDDEQDEDDEDDEDEPVAAHAAPSAGADWLPDWSPYAVLAALVSVSILFGLGLIGGGAGSPESDETAAPAASAAKVPASPHP